MDCSMDVENRPTGGDFTPPQREFGRLVFQEQGGEMTFALVKPVVIIGRYGNLWDPRGRGLCPTEPSLGCSFVLASFVLATFPAC